MSLFYTIINYTGTDAGANTWLEKMLPNCVSAILGVISGGMITYIVNKQLKRHDAKTISKNSAQYISLILRQQFGSAMGLKKQLDKTKNDGSPNKWIISPLPVGINQETMKNYYFIKGFININI